MWRWSNLLTLLWTMKGTITSPHIRLHHIFSWDYHGHVPRLHGGFQNSKFGHVMICITRGMKCVFTCVASFRLTLNWCLVLWSAIWLHCLHQLQFVDTQMVDRVQACCWYIKFLCVMPKWFSWAILKWFPHLVHMLIALRG
jgi:hypothetical protein